jgi:hypothetical protein
MQINALCALRDQWARIISCTRNVLRSVKLQSRLSDSHRLHYHAIT